MFIREHLSQSGKITDARFEVLDARVDRVDGCVSGIDALSEEGEVVCHGGYCEVRALSRFTVLEYLNTMNLSLC